ncbi:MAG: DUF4430 domain-containing protein [Oscillospiraceae bacterium]
MKKIKRILPVFLSIIMLMCITGCDITSDSKSEETLNLDYIGEDSGEEITDKKDDDGWLAWLKNALTADRSTKKQKSTEKTESIDSTSKPETVKEYYQLGKEDYETKKNNSSSSISNSVSSEKNEDKKNDKKNESSSTPSSSYPLQSENEEKENKNTVTITIRCDTATKNGMHLESKWAGIVPASGVILPVTKVEIKEGDTVFNVLTRVCEKYKIHMEYSGGTNSGCYVEGINNLYEFDGGRWSGWMYCVNDWYPNYGCGVYFLKPGEVIEWNYTCDLGCDLPNGDPYGFGKDWKDNHD